MKEAIVIPVMCETDEEDHELRIEHEDNVLFFYLDGVSTFDGDFKGNFEEAFKRAIELWG